MQSVHTHHPNKRIAHDNHLWLKGPALWSSIQAPVSAIPMSFAPSSKSDVAVSAYCALEQTLHRDAIKAQESVSKFEHSQLKDGQLMVG